MGCVTFIGRIAWEGWEPEGKGASEGPIRRAWRSGKRKRKRRESSGVLAVWFVRALPSSLRQWSRNKIDLDRKARMSDQFFIVFGAHFGTKVCVF
jgi:hypothetical protein